MDRADTIQLEERVAFITAAAVVVIGWAAFAHRANALQARQSDDGEVRLWSELRSGHTAQSEIAQDTSTSSCKKPNIQKRQI